MHQLKALLFKLKYLEIPVRTMRYCIKTTAVDQLEYPLKKEDYKIRHRAAEAFGYIDKP